ncbi:MAG TPA: hypothetical protein VLB73_01710 [Patescibacteria group bacterium]|nr:hypothetical protein [Patescibacteria group bacterium]
MGTKTETKIRKHRKPDGSTEFRGHARITDTDRDSTDDMFVSGDSREGVKEQLTKWKQERRKRR